MKDLLGRLRWIEFILVASAYKVEAVKYQTAFGTRLAGYVERLQRFISLLS